MKTLIFCLCGILIFASCDRKGYKKITEADEAGNIIGDADPTDWTEDDKWKSGIDELIAQGCDLEGVGTASSVTVNHAFPNPTNGISNIVFEVGDTCLMRFVIVDKYNTVYERNCMHLSTGVNFFAFNIAELAVSVGGRYRLYYDFLDESNTVFYKGHGDIHFQ